MTKKEQLLAKAKKNDDYQRWLSPNLKWREFAWKEGITVYPAPRGGGTYFLYRGKGEMFKREGNKAYDYESQDDMREMYADIDRAYERYYKMKNGNI